MSFDPQNLVSFLGKLPARDQTNKAVQYGARLLAYIYSEQGNKDSAAKMKSLASTVSAGRNLFRFGNTINYYSKLAKAMQSPVTLRSSITFGNDLLMAMYFVFDSLVFLTRAKVYSGNQEALQLKSFRFWASGLFFAVLDKYLEISKLRRQRKALLADTTRAVNREERIALDAKLNTLYSNITKDILNFIVAFEGSKLPVPFKFSEPVVCTCGLLAALLSCQAAWPEPPAKSAAVSVTPKVA